MINTKPLTAWQKLRVQATAGLPVKVTPDDLRLFANVGEYLDQMIDQNVKLLQDRQALMDANGDLLRRIFAAERAVALTSVANEELIKSNAKLGGALLLWQVIALCALAVLIAVVGAVW